MGFASCHAERSEASQRLGILRFTQTCAELAEVMTKPPANPKEPQNFKEWIPAFASMTMIIDVIQCALAYFLYQLPDFNPQFMTQCDTLPSMPLPVIIPLNLMKLVKIKVRPKQNVQFPSLCVHCGQPAPAAMPIHKRIGRTTRTIAVPLCTSCAQTIARQSGEEERLRKIGLLVATAVFLITTAIILIATPAGLSFILRLLIALLIGGGVTFGVFVFFRRAISNAALPEKKAILQSAQIETFSWRATTFSFTNDAFTERFIDLNEPFLMEI